MSTDKSHNRHKNSVMSSVTLKSQQQKNRKQQLITEIINAEWHSLIDRLNEFADDFLKNKEEEQYQNKILNMMQCVHTFWMQTNQSKNFAQKQLLRIKKKLNNLTERSDSMN